MKTAEEWRSLILSNDLKPEHQSDKIRLVEAINQIQHDAYEQGRTDTMKWVSRECKRVTEHLTSLNQQ